MILRVIGVFAASCFITGCGGSSSDSSSSDAAIGDSVPQPSFVENSFVPAFKNIEQVSFVDAFNTPLSFADVVFMPVNSHQIGTRACLDTRAKGAVFGTTNGQGDLSLVGLGKGKYDVMVCKSGVDTRLTLTIVDDNSASSALIAVPVVTADYGVVTALPGGHLLVSIAGIIYSNKGVVANAQVALSGGALTNGAMTTAITDDDGFYSLVINMNKDKLLALQHGTLHVVAEGFESLAMSGQDFTQFAAFSGVNLALTARADDVVDAGVFPYREDFERVSSAGVCGEWRVEGFDIDSEADEVNLWHSHHKGLGLVNQAYVSRLVSLAPNDDSLGKLPDPAQGVKACWYGKGPAGGGIVEGNFLNEHDESYDAGYDDNVDNGDEGVAAPLDGGTSIAEHGGALVSPVIDFSSEGAPLALTFKTWWEIEAINPNDDGFDLMSIDYQIQGEKVWQNLARLNPLTDPVVVGDVSALPYSNAGFNQAPRWLQQEPITLDALAGKVFKLRFSFSTVDHLYNGFRGWLIDEVTVIRQLGTFPIGHEKMAEPSSLAL